jgi:hypothetical protein
LPKTNPFLNEFSNRFKIPFEATRGGAETMYPEYVQKLKKASAEASFPATGTQAKR